MVLVVEGYVKEETQGMSMEECIELVDEEINNGLSKKEAIKNVALKYNVNKKELYNFYHNEKGE